MRLLNFYFSIFVFAVSFLNIVPVRAGELDGKTCVVITSINAPTEHVKKFANIPDSCVIVVGDKKTPEPYTYKDVLFLSVNNKLGYNLERILPFNSYSRKMLGYIYAAQNGAAVIFETDDDNSPRANWHLTPFEGTYQVSHSDLGFKNVYAYYTKRTIWPRGLPLNLVTDKKAALTQSDLKKKKVKVGVWQSLANGDPDVDAIFRLTRGGQCTFDQKEPVVLAQGTLSPFNTQATFFNRELFPLLYLPTTETFRCTDILRSLVAQPIMWAHGYRLGFTAPMVEQIRNPHDLMKDFKDEIPCYLYADKVAAIVQKVISPDKSITDNLYAAYAALVKEKIVAPEELIPLKAWIEDIRFIVSSD